MNTSQALIVSLWFLFRRSANEERKRQGERRWLVHAGMSRFLVLWPSGAHVRVGCKGLLSSAAPSFVIHTHRIIKTLSAEGTTSGNLFCSPPRRPFFVELLDERLFQLWVVRIHHDVFFFGVHWGLVWQWFNWNLWLIVHDAIACALTHAQALGTQQFCCMTYDWWAWIEEGIGMPFKKSLYPTNKLTKGFCFQLK